MYVTGSEAVTDSQSHSRRPRTQAVPPTTQASTPHLHTEDLSAVCLVLKGERRTQRLHFSEQPAHVCTRGLVEAGRSSGWLLQTPRPLLSCRLRAVEQRLRRTRDGDALVDPVAVAAQVLLMPSAFEVI